MNILAELLKLFYWNVHVLMVPLRIFTTINADLRSPFLTISNFDINEGIHLIERTTTINLQMSILNVKTKPSNSWHDESCCCCRSYDNLRLNDNLWLHHLWLHHLRLHHLGLHHLGLHHLWLGRHHLWLNNNLRLYVNLRLSFNNSYSFIVETCSHYKMS